MIGGPTRSPQIPGLKGPTFRLCPGIIPINLVSAMARIPALAMAMASSIIGFGTTLSTKRGARWLHCRPRDAWRALNFHTMVSAIFSAATETTIVPWKPENSGPTTRCRIHGKNYCLTPVAPAGPRPPSSLMAKYTSLMGRVLDGICRKFISTICVHHRKGIKHALGDTHRASMVQPTTDRWGAQGVVAVWTSELRLLGGYSVSFGLN